LLLFSRVHGHVTLAIASLLQCCLTGSGKVTHGHLAILFILTQCSLGSSTKQGDLNISSTWDNEMPVHAAKRSNPEDIRRESKTSTVPLAETHPAFQSPRQSESVAKGIIDCILHIGNDNDDTRMVLNVLKEKSDVNCIVMTRTYGRRRVRHLSF
jgi:hypothetical protein